MHIIEDNSVHVLMVKIYGLVAGESALYITWKLVCGHMCDVAVWGHVCNCAVGDKRGGGSVDVRRGRLVRHLLSALILYIKDRVYARMFDERDADFRKARSEPRLGVPVLTEKGMIFLSECRFGFDQYNVEFMKTTVGPRLRPPIMLRDGSVSCVRA